MRTKSEILSRLDELRQNRDDVSELFAPVIEAVEQYFTGDGELMHDVQYTLHQVVRDAISRSIVYEKQNLLPPAGTDYPPGYEDVRGIFTGGGAFEEIMDVDIEAFNVAYSTEAPSEADETAEPQLVNEYLASWLAKLQSARSEELTALGKLSAFCESGGWNSGLVQLFEPLGEIVSTVPLDDLAKQIYGNKGYKEIIEAFGLDVYIPSIIA